MHLPGAGAALSPFRPSWHCSSSPDCSVCTSITPRTSSFSMKWIPRSAERHCGGRCFGRRRRLPSRQERWRNSVSLASHMRIGNRPCRGEISWRRTDMSRKVLELTMVFLLCAVGPATTIQAQLGKSQGVVDMNTFLLAQGLTQDQAMTLYGKAFVHINLNTATSEEIMLVPNAGRRMAREFAEYRPWKTWGQFDKEIGKYVGAEATAKLAQYTFIPMDANTATDEDLKTIPAADAALIGKIKAGRPYQSAADLEQAVSKGVNPGEGKRVARYFAF